MSAVETGTPLGTHRCPDTGLPQYFGKPTLNKRQKRPIAAFIFFCFLSS